jgi:type IV pilus assembly protein PilM
VKAISNLSSLLGKSNKGVGIELAPERINIVQLRKQRQGVKLESLITVPVPEGMMVDGQISDPPGMAQIIQQAIGENQIKASRVATCVPHEMPLSVLSLCRQSWMIKSCGIWF